MSSPKYKPSLSKSEQDKLRKQFTRKLALHLRKVREEKGLTQEDLAFKAGVNTAYYSHLERGVYSPTMFVIWRLAQALGLDLENFMTGFESRDSEQA
ncbi:helix-turn-helix transcriptional regulator [Candidatus Roizmanbacteria bacterium]|nr:MAG: helix-turn-helix transcriptional regulator [Candidatus Roizmanbacteria bacterium]